MAAELVNNRASRTFRIFTDFTTEKGARAAQYTDAASQLKDRQVGGMLAALIDHIGATDD